MGTSYEIRYCLPVTRVRFTATRSCSRDALQDPDVTKVEISTSAAELIVGADTRDPILTAKIETGWVRNTSVSLTLTDDQRLNTVSDDSEGQIGAVATGVAGAMVFAAGALAPFAGAPAAVASRAAGLAAGARYFDLLGAELSVEPGGRRKRRAPVDPQAAYADKCPIENDQRLHYQELAARLRKQALTLAEEAAGSHEPSDLLYRLDMLGRLQAEVDTNLQRLADHFKAWRSASLMTWTEDMVAELEFDALPASHEGELVAEELDGEPKRIWETFGLMVARLPEEQPTHAPGWPGDVKGIRSNGIWEREPYRVGWRLWKKDPKAGLACIRTGVSQVVDAHSACRFLEFRKSIWAKRTMKATFGSGGALSGFDVQATSSAAAAAQTAGGLPSTAAAALKDAGSVSDDIAALRDRSLKQEVARAQALLALKQAEMTTSGLAATAADYAQLQRLQQQVEIAKARATLGSSGS